MLKAHALARIILCTLLVAVGSAGHPSVRTESTLTPRGRFLSRLGPTRPFEARLFGMEYRPYNPSIKSQIDRAVLKEFSQSLLRGNKRSREMRLADRALAEAMEGDLDRAVLLLRTAVRGQQRDERILGDLVALHLAKFDARDDSVGLLEALDTSSRAIGSEAHPELEILFNHALILQRLALQDQAREAWRVYLLHDEISPWALEARSHLSRLENARYEPGLKWKKAIARANSKVDLDTWAVELVQEFPEASREYAEDQLLGSWGTAWSRGEKGEALKNLIVARALGRALALKGEHLVSDSVGEIDAALDKGDGREIMALIRSHDLYQEARSVYKRRSCQDALPLLREAEKALAQHRSPLFLWARLQIGICEYRQFNYTSAKKALERIARTKEVDRYPALSGSVQWTLGLIEGVQGDPAASLVNYRLSSGSFQKIGEEENYAVVENLQAEALRSLGDLGSAWNHVWRALGRTPRFRVPINRYRVMARAAELSEELGFAGAAIVFMDEAASTTSDAEPAHQVTGLRRKAVLYVRLKEFASAREALVTARRMLPSIGDSDLRLALEGDLLAIEGEILSINHPGEAVRRLDHAIEIYRNTSYLQQLTQLHFLRGRIRLANGRPDLAAEDLDLAIDAVEKQRLIISEQDRQRFFDESRSIYDEMVRVQLMLGRPVAALSYSEKLRSRALWDSLVSRSGRGSPMADLESIQHEIPGHAALLEYVVTGNDIYVLLVREGRVVGQKLALTRQDLKRAVASLLKVTGSEAQIPGFLEASAALFDGLVKPLLPSLVGSTRLIVVPDRELYNVPFSALWSRSAKRFLVEDFSIIISPGASVYAAAARRKREFSGVPSRILLVANSVLQDGVWSALPNLPGAQREVEEVASLYSDAEILLEEGATPAAFLARASKFDVIHIAAHALTDTKDPDLSFIVLDSSGEPGDTGALYAHQIAHHSFLRTRIVFLATCGSLGGRISDTEGVMSLARPFLAQGVPSIIGSLWPINDDGADELAVRVHQALLSGLDSADSLRQAQLGLILKNNGLAEVDSWMAFQAIGH